MANDLRLRNDRGVIVADGCYPDVLLLSLETLSYSQRPGFLVHKGQVIFTAPNGEMIEYMVRGYEKTSACLVLQRFQARPQED